MAIPSYLFPNRRFSAALFSGAASVVVFWLGLGLPDMPFTAQPASTASRQDLAFSLEERSRLLQCATDSAALCLGAVFGALADDNARQIALVSALDSLTFEPAGEAYFTAWNGTRILHSPLCPDAAGMDFSAARDRRGKAFVLEMERLAREEGGFVRVSLPRQRAPRESLNPPAPGPHTNAKPAPGPRYRPDPFFLSNAPAASAGHPRNAVGPDLAPGQAPSPAVAAFEAVDQLLYVRGIPDSTWHIAAFMPTAPEAASRPGAFPASGAHTRVRQPGRQDPENGLRKGLFICGFALAGLAGVLFFTAHRRGRGSR